MWTQTKSLSLEVDGAGPAVFRILFGLLGFWSALRFILNDWIERFFVVPTFFFKYQGFEWVTAWSQTGMYIHFGLIALSALLVTLGLIYRVSVVDFFHSFTYVEFIDVTNYLNHYYFISLVSFLMIFMPLNRCFSLDAWFKPSRGSGHVPLWVLNLLRFQVGCVYLYAGVAKMGADWLQYAQPLNIWLSPKTDMPLVGPWMDSLWLHYGMSWMGCFFDTTIVFWLLWKRSRPFAYGVVVFFHLFTGYLFNIGLFPVIMMASATIFFDPSWPRRLLGSSVPGFSLSAPLRPGHFWGLHGFGKVLILGYCLVQLLLPLRTFTYDGNVLWHEAGMRWSWRVMVRQKTASLTYKVTLPKIGRTTLVSPSKYLTRHQEREISTQPDLILQLAHHIARDFEAKGHESVEVRAEVTASLNGRRAQVLVDPTIDLAKEEDGFGPKSWVLPAPTDPPLQLNRKVARHSL